MEILYCSLTSLQDLQLKPLLSSYEIITGRLMLTFYNLQTLELVNFWKVFLIS